jgi:hypothetical protein
MSAKRGWPGCLKFGLSLEICRVHHDSPTFEARSFDYGEYTFAQDQRFYAPRTDSRDADSRHHRGDGGAIAGEFCHHPIDG